MKAGRAAAKATREAEAAAAAEEKPNKPKANAAKA
jgi:hypothetical protein